MEESNFGSVPEESPERQRMSLRDAEKESGVSNRLYYQIGTVEERHQAQKY